MTTQPDLLAGGIGIGAEPPQEALIATNGHLKVVVRRSEKFGELVAALAKAQQDFDPVLKDQKNPYYNSKYADLASVVSATQPHLAKNSLVIIQHASVDVEKQRVTITSTLAHSSDQWVENELVLPAIMLGKDGRPRFDAQSCGAAMTYGRRYSYQGLAGVAAEQDDDGNAAVGIGSKQAQEAVAQRKIEQSSVPSSLFWVWHDESQMAELIISQEIKKNVWPFVKRFWQDHVKACMLNGEELEGLKYEMEQQGIPFGRLKSNDLTDPLKASIAAAKEKKAKREPGEDAK